MVQSFFHGSTWNDPLCQGHCVYFATLITSIHYSEQSVVDSRKFEGYCVLFKESNCSPALTKVPIYSTKVVAVIFLCSHPILSWSLNKKWSFPLRISSVDVTKSAVSCANFIFCAVGKRVKLTNSILLIRTWNDSQYLLWKFYSLSSENNQGQGLRSRTFCGWGRCNEFCRNSRPAVVDESSV